MLRLLLVGSALAASSVSSAMLVTTHTDSDILDGATKDGVISSGEYSTYSYAGSGSGFGGPLGSGTLYFESDSTNLYIGAALGYGSLGSNIVTLYLDTRSGGFSSDTAMNDTADPGRRVVSDLSRDATDTLPIQADFALQFGGSFTNFFELTSGSHNFINPSPATATGVREVSIPLSLLGLTGGSTVGFFTTLISETQFSSNEGVPLTGFSGNPGFGSGTLTWSNYNTFVTAAAVPEVSPALVLPLAAAAVTTLQTLTSRRRESDD